MRLIYLTLGASLALILSLALLPTDWARALLEEHGVVEMISALLPLAAAALAALRFRARFERVALSAILLLFSYRELGLGWHDAIFTMRPANLLDYADPHFSFSEKIAGGLLLLVFMGLLAGLIWRNGRVFFERIGRQDEGAMAMALGLGFLVISQVAEDIHKRLAAQEGMTEILLLASEEVLEMAAQTLFLLAVLVATDALPRVSSEERDA